MIYAERWRCAPSELAEIPNSFEANVWRNGGKLREMRFGTVDAILPASPPDGPVVDQGRQTMTYNLTSLQSMAVSLVGALIAASLFISAAVGPVGQLV